MVYDFNSIRDNFYAIKVEDKVYGVLLELATPVSEREEAKSYIYLLDEEEKVICKVGSSYSQMLKASSKGTDVVELSLESLASEAKKITKIDFIDTFKAIRKDMKQNQDRT